MSLADKFQAIVDENTSSNTPTASLQTSLDCQIFQHPTKDDHAIVEAKYRLKRTLTEKEQTTNIIFMLDHSESMKEHHALTLLKGITGEIVKALKPTDTFSIIRFNHEAEVLITQQPCAQFTPEAIKQLTPIGKTDLAQPFTLLPALFAKNCHNVVLFVTDGNHTAEDECDHERDDWRQMTKEMAAKIPAHAILIPVGIGAGYNPILMNRLTGLVKMRTPIHIAEKADYAHAQKVIQFMLTPLSPEVTLSLTTGETTTAEAKKGRLVLNSPLDFVDYFTLPKADLGQQFACQLVCDAKTTLKRYTQAAKLPALTSSQFLDWAKQQIHDALLCEVDTSDKRILLGAIEKIIKDFVVSDTEQTTKDSLLKLVEKGMQGLSGHENALRAAQYGSDHVHGMYFQASQMQQLQAAQPSYHSSASDPVPATQRVATPSASSSSLSWKATQVIKVDSSSDSIDDVEIRAEPSSSQNNKRRRRGSSPQL